MGIFLYIILIILGALYVTKPKKQLFYFYFIVIIIFIITIRIYPKGVDFVEYYRYLHYFTFDFRHIREFVYFFISFNIFNVINNEIITFILLDVIWVLILFKIQQQLHLEFNSKNHIFFVIIFTSFPLFFGYENIYRQLFAEIFSLYAYSIRTQSINKSNLFFILAIFSHNTALVILPLLMIRKNFNFSIKIRVLTSTGLSIIYILLFEIASQYKSGHETGLNMGIFYLLIFTILVYIFIIKNNFNIITFIDKFPSLYIGLILILSLVLLPIGNMVVERIGMFFLIFVIYDLYAYSFNITNKYKQVLFRLNLLLLFSLPVILFQSSRNML